MLGRSFGRFGALAIVCLLGVVVVSFGKAHTKPRWVNLLPVSISHSFPHIEAINRAYAGVMRVPERILILNTPIGTENLFPVSQVDQFFWSERLPVFKRSRNLVSVSRGIDAASWKDSLFRFESLSLFKQRLSGVGSRNNRNNTAAETLPDNSDWRIPGHFNVVDGTRNISWRVYRLRQIKNSLHCYPCSIGRFLKADGFPSHVSSPESENGQSPIRPGCWPKRFFPVIPIMRLILGGGLLFLANWLYLDVMTKWSSRAGVVCLALGMIILLAPIRWEILCGCDPHEHAEYGQTNQ